MTIALSSETEFDWPEGWSAIDDDTPWGTRWNLDRAANRLLDVVTTQPLSLPSTFQFRWRAGRYSIQLQESADAAVLRLSGIVGTIPFTCEDRSSRRRVLDTLRHMRDVWPCAGFTLTRGQVQLLREIPAERPALSFREMIAQASSVLLPVKPVIELIESDLWPAA